MTRQNADYGYDIQKVYLEMMLTDAETFVRCQAVFDDVAFDRRLQPAAKFINDYVSLYKFPKDFIKKISSDIDNDNRSGEPGSIDDWIKNS